MNVTQPPPAVRPIGLKPPQNANVTPIWVVCPLLGAKFHLDSTLEPTGSTAGGGCATLSPKI